MSALIEYEEITSRRMLLDLIDRHGHVVITQNERVIFEANRRQNPDSIFATLELVSDPVLREAIREGLEDADNGRVYSLEEVEQMIEADELARRRSHHGDMSI